MEQNQFKCTGNCLNCMPAQRGYCASQHAYSNMKVLDAMMDMMVAMQGDMKQMAQKIEAMQNNEAAIFDPSLAEIDTAQEGDGAVTIDPHNNSL